MKKHLRIEATSEEEIKNIVYILKEIFIVHEYKTLRITNKAFYKNVDIEYKNRR